MSMLSVSPRAQSQIESVTPDTSTREQRLAELLERVRAVSCPVTQPWLERINRDLHALAVGWTDPLIDFPATSIEPLEIHLIDKSTYGVHADYEGVKLIGIDRQLLQTVTSEDAVAFVIGHEIGHELYRARYGIEKGTRATAAEEMFCDKVALDLITLAGYSPRGGLELFEKVIEKREALRLTELDTLANIAIDEHFGDYSRWAQIKEDFEGVTRLRSGASVLSVEERALVPIPAEVEQGARDVEFVPVVKQFLNERGFDALRYEDKLRVLSDAIALLTNAKRGDDFCGAFSIAVREQGFGKAVTAELHELFDRVLDEGLKGNAHCRSVALRMLQSLGHFVGAPPLGRLRLVDRLVARSLGNAATPPPSAEVLREVRNVLAGCKYSGQEVVDEWGNITAPSVRLRWSVEKVQAIEAASLDQTGRKASLLFATLAQDFHFSTFVDRMPLPVLQASTRYLKNEQLDHLVAERAFWERDVASYEYFRENPGRYLAGLADAFETKKSSRYAEPRQRTAIHPYAGAESSADRAKAHDRWSAILVGHLERYLRENPLKAAVVAKSLFLGQRLTVPEKLLFGGTKSLAYELGYKEYPITAPLSQFVLRHPGLFPDANRDKALLRLGVDVDLPTWEAAIGFRYPRTLGCLRQMNALLNRHPFFDDYIGRAKPLWSAYIAEIISSGLSKPRFVDSLVRVIGDSGHLVNNLFFRSTSPLRSILREQVFTSPIEPPEKYYNSFSLRGLVSLVCIGERASLFSSPSEREVASAILARRLAGALPMSTRVELCIKVLNAPPMDVHLREEVTSILARSYRARFGRDSGLDSFAQKVRRQITIDVLGIPEDLRLLLCKKTADELESQERLSFILRDIALPSQEGPEELHLPLKGAELFLRTAGKDSVRMEDTMRFLLDPLTPESLERFRGQIEGWKVSDSDQQAKYGSFAMILGIDFESPETQAIWLHTLHRHISSLPVESKALIMKQILVGPERLYQDGEDTYRHAVAYTLDRLFPPGNPNTPGEVASDTDWTRVVVESFVLAAHPSERGYLLAAMLGAGQSSAGQTARPGQQLKRIFEHLGPAYIKLGQAIHSYPRTPADIRQDLSGLKGMAAVPPRWELFEMIASRMDPQTRAELARVGTIRGAASFNIVATYRNKFFQRGAFSLLRPYALERAVKGFDDLTKTVDVVVERDPNLAQFRVDALRVLRHAQEMCSTETNMEIGQLQHQAARNRYEGRLYVAGGIPLRVTTARWRTFGDGYRTMDEAPGVTFDELPERTRPQRWFKRSVAKAIVACELESILSGQKFDYDRHERQYHVAGTTIIALDHGGEALQEPRDDDRRCLAGFVGGLADRILTGEEATSAVQAALQDGLGESDYAQRLQKGLLAMSGIMSHLDASDFTGIVATCLLQGTVCSEVRAALERVVAGNPRAAMLETAPLWLRNVGLWKATGLLSTRFPRN